MTWKDRSELLKYHSEADDEKRRLANNARNTLVDFADELMKRTAAYTVNKSTFELMLRIIDDLLTEAGVEQ